MLTFLYKEKNVDGKAIVELSKLKGVPDFVYEYDRTRYRDMIEFFTGVRVSYEIIDTKKYKTVYKCGNCRAKLSQEKLWGSRVCPYCGADNYDECIIL